ncbi:hypothetical protein GF324_08795 [bacterium]|nr:hypothetical protein [bacterium]
MKPLVFVTGMFRSGTTLMARMLGAHPNLAFASDPFQPTLKEFRNTVWANLVGVDQMDAKAPFDDYYFYPDKQQLMKAVQQTGLDLSIGNLDLPGLRATTARYAHDFSPKIEPYLELLNGPTFADLLATGGEVIERAYGDKNTQAVGFKITWACEFGPHLLRQWDNAKVVHIVRDPRAVCSSKYALEGRKNPFIFLVRQWRKLVTLPWVHLQDSFPYRDRVHVLRYEDLVSNPESEVERLCEFLELPMSERMLDPSRYDDGSGKVWEPNTSYREKKKQFNTSSIDKWRSVLNGRQIEFIERLALPEMAVWGYEPEIADSHGIPASMVYDPPEVPLEELVEWIIPYTRYEPHTLLHDMVLEQMRANTLAGGDEVADDIKSALALDPDFFDALRSKMMVTAL